MHSAFAQFLAIGQKDEADNLKTMERKLTMPVLAIGAEKAFGANVAVVMRNAATKRAGSRRAESRPLADGEAPAATIAAVRTSSQRPKPAGCRAPSSLTFNGPARRPGRADLLAMDNPPVHLLLAATRS